MTHENPFYNFEGSLIAFILGMERGYWLAVQFQDIQAPSTGIDSTIPTSDGFSSR